MSACDLDFLIYLGDPDEGAEALPSGEVLAQLDAHRDKLEFPDVYGAVILRQAGKEIAARRPDPALSLITKFVRVVPYVIDGESETALLSESEHGFMFEPAGDEVLVSFFSGDAYEPDEYLAEQIPIKVQDFSEQVLSMAERLRDVIKAAAPEFLESDDYATSLVDFIDGGRQSLKTLNLQLERGLRVM